MNSVTITRNHVLRLIEIFEKYSITSCDFTQTNDNGIGPCVTVTLPTEPRITVSITDYASW